MNLTRRKFLATAAALSAGVSFAPRLAFSSAAGKAKSPQRILILGGTGFLGPACTESALARGHLVTHFNSGRTEERRKEAGRPSIVPEGVEQLRGNRDPNKTADDRRTEGKPGAQKDPNSPLGLTSLKGRKWEAVIDTSGYFPRMVKASAELLAPNVRQYVFISSISVYKATSTAFYDETAPVQSLADPESEDMGPNLENFGAGKAMCEKAAEAAMPGRVTNIRPGFIVGPRDTSGRFVYWPVRTSLGGEMAIPGSPEDPIQIIDARDLSDWIIHCIEENVTGVYNATGPAKELSMKAMLEGINDGIGSKTSFTWVPLELFQAHGVEGLPLYAPPVGETAGFHRCNVSRALAKGLKFRRVSDTAKATLEWYRSLPAELQPRIAPQVNPRWMETEKAILARFRAKDQAAELSPDKPK